MIRTEHQKVFEIINELFSKVFKLSKNQQNVPARDEQWKRKKKKTKQKNSYTTSNNNKLWVAMTWVQ